MAETEKRQNMYGDSVAQLPWFQGCGQRVTCPMCSGKGYHREKSDGFIDVPQSHQCFACLGLGKVVQGHNCRYCGFRLQAYRQMPHYDEAGTKTRGCQDCYDFVTHAHFDRIKKYPGKKTTGDQFNWIGASGEPAYLPFEDIEVILAEVRKRPDRQFFLQTKDPRWWADHEFPANCWLGITLETNRDEGYNENISNALKPSERFYAAMNWVGMEVAHHHLHAITVEPVQDFDLVDLGGMIASLSPDVVYIGYNSKPKHFRLPEPPLEKTMALIAEIEGFTRVKPKLLREAVA